MKKLLPFFAASFLAISFNAAPANSAGGARKMPAVCEVLPIAQMTDFINDPPEIECGWAVPIGVNNGVMTGGIAGIQTVKNMAVYSVIKDVQQNLIDTFGSDQGITVNDQSGFLNCTESRMVVLSDNGVPAWSHFTALCDGLGISYVTVGPEYSTDDAEKFNQIVTILVGEKRI